MTRCSLFLALCVLLAPSISVAEDCWSVSNLRGYSAFGDLGYKFSEDGLSDGTTVCFTPNGGTVSGSNLQFTRFGTSTLAGYVRNSRGTEVFEIYQIDRARNKLLYVRTRIWTKLTNPALSDVVSSFVGDATQVTQ